MEFKEFLKNQLERVDNQEEKDSFVSVFVDSELNFTYHKDCFADYQEDFVILYDKKSKANLSVRYESISALQYGTAALLEEQMMRKSGLSFSGDLFE